MKKARENIKRTIKRKKKAENNVNKEEEIGDSHTSTSKVRRKGIQRREEKCVGKRKEE